MNDIKAGNCSNSTLDTGMMGLPLISEYQAQIE